jgi:hypothetical protein
MVSPFREPIEAASNAYPQLDAMTLSTLNERLIGVVSLLHREGLTDAQLRELTISIGIQTKSIETLHKFALSNADEPAFTVRLYSGDLP